MNRRAVIDPVTLVLIVAIGAGAAALAGWRPFAFLKKKPPTEELTKLQADLAQKRAELDRLQKEHAQTEETVRSKFDLQIQDAQYMNRGAVIAYGALPEPQRTAGVNLMFEFATRAQLRLIAVRGNLSADLEQELQTAVHQALTEQRAEYERLMKEKDAAFGLVTAQLEAARQESQEQAGAIVAATAREKETQAKVTASTNQVKEYAAAKATEERRNGSLLASLHRWLVGAGIVGAAYLLLAYVLPGIVKVMNPGPLRNTLRNLSGYTLNPIHFHDAKKKIANLSNPQPKTPV